MEQPDMLPIVYCQYHGCWCPGDLSRQGISSHGIDQISCNIPFLASDELRMYWQLESFLIQDTDLLPVDPTANTMHANTVHQQTL